MQTGTFQFFYNSYPPFSTLFIQVSCVMIDLPYLHFIVNKEACVTKRMRIQPPLSYFSINYVLNQPMLRASWLLQGNNQNAFPFTETSLPYLFHLQWNHFPGDRHFLSLYSLIAMFADLCAWSVSEWKWSRLNAPFGFWLCEVIPACPPAYPLGCKIFFPHIDRFIPRTPFASLRASYN